MKPLAVKFKTHKAFDINEVLYIHGVYMLCHIYFRDPDKKSILVSLNIGQMEERMPELFRPNISYLVNPEEIVEAFIRKPSYHTHTHPYVVLSNGMKLNVGPKFFPKLQEMYTPYHWKKN